MRFACDGEEIGGSSIVDWLVADEHGVDVAVVFDGDATTGDPGVQRRHAGLCYFHLEVADRRPPLRDVRGAALNAMHVAAGARGRDAARRSPSPEPPVQRAVPPIADEPPPGRQELQPGAEALEEQGAVLDGRARPRTSISAPGPSPRSTCTASGGSPRLVKTVLSVHAEANASIRLSLTRIRRRSPCCSSACLEQRRWRGVGGDGSVQEPTSAHPTRRAPAVVIGLDAFEHAVVTAVAVGVSGGSIPLVAALSAREIPALVTGFGLPRLEHPFTERTAPGGIPPAWRGHGCRAAAPARRAGERVMEVAPSAAGLCEPAGAGACGRCPRPLRPVRQIDTQAVEGSSTYPSSERQLDLSRLLLAELRGLGLEDAELTEHADATFVTPSTVDFVRVVGLIARRHDAGRAGRRGDLIVHKAYAGGPIALFGDEREVLDLEELPELAARIVTTSTSDGTTLLGADDKAGVADHAGNAYLLRHPEPGRAPPRIAFTVDEEVGHGTDHFDLDRFGADFVGTLDVVRDRRARGRDAFRLHRPCSPRERRPSRLGQGPARRMPSSSPPGCSARFHPTKLSPETTEGREDMRIPCASAARWSRPWVVHRSRPRRHKARGAS